VEVAFSEEPGEALETGGGVLHAAALFRGDAPFFLHNADILSDLPLRRMYEAHRAAAPLATLAVMERATSRHLLFDDLGLLGRTDERKGVAIRAREAVGEVRRLAFAGVHVVSPEFLDGITERGTFSILDPYLRRVGEGAVILPFRIDGCHWTDIGKPEQLEEARGWLSGAQISR
jgi:NDP-sugar pyrophosphorylase family protein